MKKFILIFLTLAIAFVFSIPLMPFKWRRPFVFSAETIKHLEAYDAELDKCAWLNSDSVESFDKCADEIEYKLAKRAALK